MVSLRSRWLLWLVLPLTAFVALSGWFAYRNAADTADVLQDRALLSSARMIAGQVRWDGGRLAVEIPPAAIELFASRWPDQVFFSVTDDAGRILAGNPDFAVFVADGLHGASAGGAFGSGAFAGMPVRAIGYARTMYDSGAAHQVSVTVGQTLLGNSEMKRELFLPSLKRLIAMLLLAIVLSVVGLRFGLRPLTRLSEQLAGRAPFDLAPVRADTLPSELRPIVGTINDAFARLHAHVAQQKRFIADAAHQLRTPLAVLDTQLQFAAKADDRAALQDTLQAMQASCRAMTALADKLLLLSRAEASRSLRPRAAPALTVVASVLEELVVLAQQKNIDIGAVLDAPDLGVACSEELLHALLSNLIDNAIRYSPPAATVTVRVSLDDAPPGCLRFTVSDNGPGIAPEARPHVFERFFRAAPAGEAGSGLGLAIVREIVVGAGGSVSLGPAAGGRGLCVDVTLPLASAASNELVDTALPQGSPLSRHAQ